MRFPWQWFLVICAIVALASTASARNFNIDTTADAVDAKPGDGACADAEGRCTLRAAIQEANASEDPDSLDLAAGTYKLDIESSGVPGIESGDLYVTETIAISGDGSDTTVVDGAGISRVFYVAKPMRDGTTVDISSLTIRGGKGDLGESGGGVWNAGTLRLMDVVISDNTVSADERQSGGRGGGIFNSGSATLLNCKVEKNQAWEGGGIVNASGSLTMVASSVSHNQSLTGAGGGIINRGEATISISSIDSNDAIGGGGGIENIGKLTLAASTVSSNHGQIGGGLENRGHLTLANVTLSANVAREQGGGLANLDSGKTRMNNVTASQNAVEGEPDGAKSGGGLFNAGGATMTVANSILAGNRASEGRECGGSLDLQGYNLIEDVTGCDPKGPAEQLIIGKKAMLMPLVTPKDATAVYPLDAKSPAVDAGQSETSPCEASDQRGVKRPLDGNGDGKAVCDLGAYELEPKKP